MDFRKGRRADLGAGWCGGCGILDLAFPITVLGLIGHEIATGRNWRNLPIVAALAFLSVGNLLVHFDALGIAATADIGNHLGGATLLMLISIVGGRVIPSFTRNWLARERPEIPTPAAINRFDHTVVGVTALALALCVLVPAGGATAWVALAAGIGHGARLARWRGLAILREPLLWVLHLDCGWLALGFALLVLRSP